MIALEDGWIFLATTLVQTVGDMTKPNTLGHKLALMGISYTTNLSLLAHRQFLSSCKSDGMVV